MGLFIRCLLTQVVEVEWVLSGQRAVEPGLEVRAPAALVLVGAAAVRLADACDAGVDGLQCKGESEGKKRRMEVGGGSSLSSYPHLSQMCRDVACFMMAANEWRTRSEAVLPRHAVWNLAFL